MNHPILAKLQNRIAIKGHQQAIRSLSTNPDNPMKIFNPQMDRLLAQLDTLEARAETKFPGAALQARELHRSSFNGGSATLTRPPAPAPAKAPTASAPAPALTGTESFDARYMAARKAGGSALNAFITNNKGAIRDRLSK